MNNREKRTEVLSVHLYLALARTSHGEKHNCIRHVIKDEEKDLNIFIAKLKAIGGNWRIHKTLNARNVEKARKWLLHDLIDHPEHASYIDTQWRTALLQPECKETSYFMLDIDTQDIEKIKIIEEKIVGEDGVNVVFEKIKTTKGWHYLCYPFDTREVCKLDYVTLLRDGYYFVTKIENEEIK